MSDSNFHIRATYAAAGIAVVAAGLGGTYAAGGNIGFWLVAMYLALGLAVAVLPAWHLTRSIFHPLTDLRQTIATTRSDGNLARTAVVPAGSAIAPVAHAYNELIGTFHGIVSRIVFNSKEVAGTAETLILHAQQTADSSRQQSEAAEAAATAVAEMHGGVQEVARNAEETARIAEYAREHSSRGAAIVKDASAEIDRIANSVEQTAQVVATLGQRSEAISGIAMAIREIADQTNLLALNAAIEAARAGEQGRGFAVVADEVRKLAERTATATTEITSMIEAINKETHSAITTIEQGATQARNGATLARQAAGALDDINRGAQETMEKVALIARAMALNSERSDAIAAHVTSIMSTAESNSDNAATTLAEARQLDYLAINLAEVGNIFKLGQAGDHAMALHEKMPGLVKDAAKQVGRRLEEAVDRGQVGLDDLFDREYVPIDGTRPQKYHTRFDTLTDNLLPPVQEPLLERHGEIAYAIACDNRGYVPTHNRRFSQPLTGDERRDMAGNRTKRIFDDPVGKRCGSHEQPSLLQTYRRDTGEIMHDISAPILVKGRHWGGFRIGYRTE